MEELAALAEPKRYKFCKECTAAKSLPMVASDNFKKIVTFLRSGIDIYHHLQPLKASTKSGLVIHNSGCMDVERSLFNKDICNYRTNCDLCQDNLKKIQCILRDISVIKQREAIGICTHCRENYATAAALRCPRCAHVAKKFLAHQVDQYSAKEKQLRHWIDKVQILLKNILDAEIFKAGRCAEFDELVKLLDAPVCSPDALMTTFPSVCGVGGRDEFLQSPGASMGVSSMEGGSREIFSDMVGGGPDSYNDVESGCRGPCSLMTCGCRGRHSAVEGGRGSDADLGSGRLQRKADAVGGRRKKGQRDTSKQGGKGHRGVKSTEKKKKGKLPKAASVARSEKKIQADMKGKKKSHGKRKKTLSESINDIADSVPVTASSDSIRSCKSDGAKSQNDAAVDVISEVSLLTARRRLAARVKKGKSRFKQTLIYREKSKFSDVKRSLENLLYSYEDKKSARSTAKERKNVDSRKSKNMETPSTVPSSSNNFVDEACTKGITSYRLSNEYFIHNGWTQLPQMKTLRRIKLYRMIHTKHEFNWFDTHRHAEVIYYPTGEKFAEIFDHCGRWFYRNGNVALQYLTRSRDPSVQRIYQIYSCGEPVRNPRINKPDAARLLAAFDYFGNGIIYDSKGRIRLQYNQFEGSLEDPDVGIPGKWRWHSLNEPPSLDFEFVENHCGPNSPYLEKIMQADRQKRIDFDPEMVMIECQKTVKLNVADQQFNPHTITMKVLKLNKHMTIRVMDQAHIPLLFCDGKTSMRINLGMELVSNDVVDFVDVGISKFAFLHTKEALANGEAAFLVQNMPFLGSYDREPPQSPPLKKTQATITTENHGSKPSPSKSASKHVAKPAQRMSVEIPKQKSLLASKPPDKNSFKENMPQNKRIEFSPNTIRNSRISNKKQEPFITSSARATINTTPNSYKNRGTTQGDDESVPSITTTYNQTNPPNPKQTLRTFISADDDPKYTGRAGQDPVRNLWCEPFNQPYHKRDLMGVQLMGEHIVYEDIVRSDVLGMILNTYENIGDCVTPKIAGLGGFGTYNYTNNRPSIRDTETTVVPNTRGNELSKNAHNDDKDHRKTLCQPCTEKFTRVRDILKSLPNQCQNEVIGICDHCKTTNAICRRCEMIRKNFFKSQGREYEERHFSVQEWISKVQELLFILLERELTCKCRGCAPSPSFLEMQKHLKMPFINRKHGIDTFSLDFDAKCNLCCMKRKMQLQTESDTSEPLKIQSDFDEYDINKMTSESASSCKPGATSPKRGIQGHSKKGSKVPKTKKNKMKTSTSKGNRDKNKGKMSKLDSADGDVLSKRQGNILTDENNIDSDSKNDNDEKKRLHGDSLIMSPSDEANLAKLRGLTQKQSSETLMCKGSQSICNELISGTKIVTFNSVEEYTSQVKPRRAKHENILHTKKKDLVEKQKRRKSFKEKRTENELKTSPNGILYQLSDLEFVKNGWTQLPVQESYRRLVVYRMIPTDMDYDWFTRHKGRVLFYNTGETLAEVDDTGSSGRWFYRNGGVALTFTRIEDAHGIDGKYIIYSDGEPEDCRSKPSPIRVLAVFDFLGHGEIFSQLGDPRLEYNQYEGQIKDPEIGTPRKWKWHLRCDRERLVPDIVLTEQRQHDKDIQSLILEHEYRKNKDTDKDSILDETEVDRDCEELLKTQGCYPLNRMPYQVRLKSCKINKHMTLRLIDQQHIYLSFRHGINVMKVNLGLKIIPNDMLGIAQVNISEISKLYVKPKGTMNSDDIPKNMA